MLQSQPAPSPRGASLFTLGVGGHGCLCITAGGSECRRSSSHARGRAETWLVAKGTQRTLGSPTRGRNLEAGHEISVSS